MDKAFDTLGSVSTGKESWRIKVRVLRLWSVYSFMKPDQVNSLEMVLIDEKGVKIHASVRRQLLYLFRSKIVEGNVYKMSYFIVCPESGIYRTTPHPFKLIFEMKTKVQSCENDTIDRFGLSLTTIAEICAYGPDHDFLVDVVGLISGISAQREYIRDGKVTRMIVLELTDNSAKCECALFGDYADDLQKMIGKINHVLPVVVLQFAKIKIFRGKVSIQNVLNATRIYVNPSIPEVVSFKESLAVDGVEFAASIPTIGPNARPSLEEDFLVNYPKTCIAKLLGMEEDGIYVVGGVVDGLVDAEDWWYPACTCHRSVSADSGAYYCKQCVKHVFKMVPRFRVKLRVDDGSGQAVFVVFDGDMSVLCGKPCHELVALSKGQNAGYYPPELDLLKGMRLLLKVEKRSSGSILFDGSFRVKRICCDLSIMDVFDSLLGKDDSGAEDEVNVEEEYVDNTQVDDFVGNLIVSPSSAKPVEEYSVLTGNVLPEVVNLGDDSDSGLEFFVPGRVGLQGKKIDSVKRNLLSAFSECDD
ncbi:replication factor A protein, partial [Trifolium medium]|nr:replication factor A protein [Trifolium medium]